MQNQLGISFNPSVAGQGIDKVNFREVPHDIRMR